VTWFVFTYSELCSISYFDNNDASDSRHGRCMTRDSKRKTFCLTKMQHIAIHAPRRKICLYYHYSYHYFIYYYKVCWSRWPRALRRGSAAARLLGMRVRNPPGTGMSVSSVCCLLSSGWCLRIGMISGAEQSYRVCSGVVCLNVIWKHQQWGGRGLLGSRAVKNNNVYL
jgi:hypothetical protein